MKVINTDALSKNKIISSELSLASGWVPVTWVWQRLRSRQESGKLYHDKREAPGVPRYRCGEAAGGLTRSRASFLMGLRGLSAFSW